MSAAGFMATSTLGSSPGVVILWSAMLTWNADTPFTVPAGARISAGKSGKRRQVVAERGAHRGESVARELHSVARVAGEADDQMVEYMVAVGSRPVDRVRHVVSPRGIRRPGAVAGPVRVQP